MIDWSGMSIDDELTGIRSAPPVAGLWIPWPTQCGWKQYSRAAVWHPEKGFCNSWNHVATVWTRADSRWYGMVSAEVPGASDFVHGPFPSKFDAARKLDRELERLGWRVAI